MNSFEKAKQLSNAGRFLDALRCLEAEESGHSDRIETQILRAELLERLGRQSQSRTAVALSLRAKNLTASQRSACEYVTGRLDLEEGDVQSAVTHLQHAVTFAHEANEPERLCWAHFALLLVLTDISGPDATGPLIAEIRLNTTRLGDPQATAALHVFVGEMEFKRGLFQSALRHATLAISLLTASPNAWLEAVAENIRLAYCIVHSDHLAGLSHGFRALELAERSAAARTCRACLGNLGSLFYALGEFDRAVAYFERAIAALPSAGENRNANLDNIAKIRLTQGRLGESDLLLARIRESIRNDNELALYAHRHSQITRIRLLERQTRLAEAIELAESVSSLAILTKDESLRLIALLTKAELLIGANRAPESMAILAGC
jgi:tetratricopeptide (TPR) repeat protein